MENQNNSNSQSAAMPCSAKWETLRWAVVVGIVDAYGAVHSKLCPLDTPTSDLFHESIFGTKGHCAWRWSFSDCITWITPEMKPDVEQYDAIQRHLTRRHGLKWWENGHHDIQHFLEQLCKEQNKENTHP